MYKARPDGTTQHNYKERVIQKSSKYDVSTTWVEDMNKVNNRPKKEDRVCSRELVIYL